MSSSLDARNRCRRSGETFGNSALRTSSSSVALNQGCSPLCACAGVMSGRSRPSTCIQRTRRFSMLVKPGMASADIGAGIQIEGTSPTSMPWNPGAATPMTVMGRRFTQIFLPTASGAPANWFFQKSCESTTTAL